ncbi:MAG: HAMP domain-containing sensor histidine kinase [Planctomycetota bacterium]|nr:HAMP domain-containing sensor histidine kinase [Planctomycetota bacterium]
MHLWTGVFIGLLAALAPGVPLVIWELKRQIRRARAAERRARRAERLAEIGAMTGGLAHEIKNPLSTIGLNAQLLAEGITELEADPAEKARLVRRVESLRREADRLRDTLADFLRFAGEVRLEPRLLDLNKVVDELVDFYLPQAQHRGIALRPDLSPEPLRAMIDPSHFKQALLNLMLNATQAMEGQSLAGGELILRTSTGKGPEGPECHVHVIDTGPGIPPDVLQSIFTPYYTTKSGGTGLGLPTTRRLIEEHGGRIEVHSEPGKGSDFVIKLPRADARG